MTDDFDDHAAFFNRRTDKTITSKSFIDSGTGEKIRIASRIIEGEPGLRFAKKIDEAILKETPAGRLKIKATFFEDDRSIKVLNIQKYNSKDNPHDEHHFSFVGKEIDTLLEFIAGLGSVELNSDDKIHISDVDLKRIVLSRIQAQSVFAKNSELFIQLAQHENLAKDIVAVGYRRNQLDHFRKLLTDEIFFQSERQRLQCLPEIVWQQFFEKNQWIFGYGLDYRFLKILQREAHVSEEDLAGKDGAISDFLLGATDFTVLVELKRPDTKLFDSTKNRAGSWRLSPELIGAVSQILEQRASWQIKSETNANSNFDSNSSLINQRTVDPKCILLIGSENQFEASDKEKNIKLRTFELFRRDSRNIEILTYDELFQRASFIVDHSLKSEVATESEELDEVPF